MYCEMFLLLDAYTVVPCCLWFTVYNCTVKIPVDLRALELEVGLVQKLHTLIMLHCIRKGVLSIASRLSVRPSVRPSAPIQERKAAKTKSNLARTFPVSAVSGRGIFRLRGHSSKIHEVKTSLPVPACLSVCLPGVYKAGQS